VEFLLAGATTVQVGTASYADPRAVQRIAESLERWCARHHIARVADLTGGLQVNQGPANQKSANEKAP
jgi:dihydroorotate dehydrogenase (NAD+) catalytic subunit